MHPVQEFPEVAHQHDAYRKWRKYSKEVIDSGLHEMDGHDWSFILGKTKSAATCFCGLAVMVEPNEAGKQTLTWTLRGTPAPPEMITRELRSDLLKAEEQLELDLAVGHVSLGKADGPNDDPRYTPRRRPFSR